MAEMIPGDQGRIRIIKVADPVAGVEWTYTQPLRTRWRLISVKARFVADANVIARALNIEFVVSTGIILKCHVRDVIVANETWEVCWFNSGVTIIPTGGRVMAGALPEKFIFNDGVIINSSTVGMRAADAYDLIFLIVEEWIEPL